MSISKSISKLVYSATVVLAIALNPLIPIAEAQPQVDCRDPNGTPEINYCAEVAYDDADKSLNRVYQQFRPTLSNAERELLTQAQRAWIRYRDTNCRFAVRSAAGGTGHQAYLNNCLERMTKVRTAQLEKQMSDRNL